VSSIFFVIEDLPDPFLLYSKDVRIGFIHEGRVLGIRVDSRTHRAMLCEYKDGEMFRLERSVPYQELLNRAYATRRSQTPLYAEYAKSFLEMNK
jgi:hypothetical protein